MPRRSEIRWCSHTLTFVPMRASSGLIVHTSPQRSRKAQRQTLCRRAPPCCSLLPGQDGIEGYTSTTTALLPSAYLLLPYLKGRGVPLSWDQGPNLVGRSCPKSVHASSYALCGAARWQRKASRWVVRMRDYVPITVNKPPRGESWKELGSALPAQSGFAGAHYGLRPVGHLQLGEDAGNVVAHRFGAHV
jgi:hypothetical protein